MKAGYQAGIFLAVLAAALYALNAPLSKLLLDFMPSTLMAGFLYLGAGLGMGVIALGRKVFRRAAKESRLTKRELPFTLAMIVLDIAAPISLMLGLKSTTAANASLLNNFEIVATAVIALAVFKESISRGFGRASCSSRSPARSCRWKTSKASAFLSARSLSCSPVYAGDLKTTAQGRSLRKTRWRSCF